MLKENKGITLVALVVTIIVLLILAGVTISLVVGQNGIITRARQAQIEQEKAYARDIVSTAIKAVEIDTQANTASYASDTARMTALVEAIKLPSFTNEGDKSTTLIYTTKDGKKVTVTVDWTNYDVTNVTDPA